jgi:putative hydrolase of the HAD superfamily
MGTRLIRTIVFDFGNVVSYFDFRRTLDRLADHTDLGADAILAAYYETDLEDQYESGRLSTPAFLEQLRDVGQLRCGVDFLAEAWADIFRPNPEVCALLPILKPRYRLLLGSNTNELHAAQFRRQFAENLRYFDALVLSHEIGVRKPHPSFFEHCQKLAGCAAAECLFIDDLPANVAGAKALGWQGIVYTGIEYLRPRLREMGILPGEPKPGAPPGLPRRGSPRQG